MTTNEPIPLSEATAYGIWSQLREQIRDDQNRPMMSCAPHDPLSKSERELYEILTRRFMYESAVVSITVEDNKP